MLEGGGVLSTLYIGPKDFKWKSHIKKGKKICKCRIFDPTLRRHNGDAFCNPHRRLEMPDKMTG